MFSILDSGNLPPPASAGLLLDPAASGQDELPPMTVRSKVDVATDAGVATDESTLLSAFKHNDGPCIYIVLLQSLAFQKPDNSGTFSRVK